MDGAEGETAERNIENGIIRSFGYSIIEFEMMLFQKFLNISGPHSITTEAIFRKHLTRMHAKGYVMPVEFQGKRCWKRLVIEDDLHEEIPTPEEILEVIERAKQKAKVEPRTSKKLVTMSMTMADDILRFLESALTEEDDYGKIAETRIRIHVKKMRRALSSSESELIDYIRLNVPSFRNPMKQLLSTKGPELVMLSLRIIESTAQ
ncbi:MAG: hypothetical protein KAW94_04310 [Candidatus Thorarchaeota archaeon]|nr:hypothetical protein [Candidatus Thorarchaeota archaeon]